MGRSVLIIDDDEKLVRLLVDFLSQYEIKVLSAHEPDAGMALLQAKKPDLVILDVMLPGRSGFEVCKEIRTLSDVPVIMLTARGEVSDRIVGLGLGADDYLPKPFDPRELLARIEAIIRRSGGHAGTVRLRFGDLTIDSDSRQVLLKGELVDLSTSEFDVLVLLARNPKRVFNRDQIMGQLRGTDWAAFDRSVDVLVSRLRHKLGDDPKRPTYIRTIWGAGYRFIAPRGG